MMTERRRIALPCQPEVPEPKPGQDRSAYAMSAMSIASPTESSSSQRKSTAPNTFLYHSSPTIFASSFTSFIPISALFMTTAHISPMLSLQSPSFSSDTTSSYPRMVSSHRLEAAIISPSEPPSPPAGRLWCSLSAVIRRKEACAGEGELCIVQSLPQHVSVHSKLPEMRTRSFTPNIPPCQGFFSRMSSSHLDNPTSL